MIVINDQTIDPKKVSKAKLDKSGEAGCYLSISYTDGSSDILRYEGEGFMERARKDLEYLASFMDSEDGINML